MNNTPTPDRRGPARLSDEAYSELMANLGEPHTSGYLAELRQREALVKGPIPTKKPLTH